MLGFCGTMRADGTGLRKDDRVKLACGSDRIHEIALFRLLVRLNGRERFGGRRKVRGATRRFVIIL